LELALLVLQDDTAGIAQFLNTRGCDLDSSLGNGCSLKWLPHRIKFDACRRDCWYEAIYAMEEEAMYLLASAATSSVPREDKATSLEYIHVYFISFGTTALARRSS